ncbi:LPS export ABC transporter ATP-binding protein [Blattabacterium cuenoti]|uniref:LPS export ABC transporter ATP-binding protein n=1 Tax=Blattabacterium cuenoti TaxID=1653831 RepID=UPI00163CAE29|nr:LPS export ABC transporter ATP-binding protein [Blattabacterium cuenoti]
MNLIAQNIYKKYNKQYVVENISFQLSQGEIVGLIGPNGSGKTTCFHMIVGIVKPTKGKIFLNEKNITEYPMYLRCRNGIGYLSQEPSIFRKLSVEENILCILEMQKKYYKNKSEITDKLIIKLKLQNIRKNRGDLLSGGERRRTEIARCLAINPKFILLDEPFSGIDPISVENLQNIILSLKKENIGILITDHNVQDIFMITDRVYLMFNGKLLKHGTTTEFMKDSLVRRIYLGNRFFTHSK